MQSKRWLPFGGVAFLQGLQDKVSQRSSLVSPGAPCFDLRRRMLVPKRWAGGGGRGLSVWAVLFVVTLMIGAAGT